MAERQLSAGTARAAMPLIWTVFAVLVLRAFFGFDGTDEAYYLATAFDRAAKGLDMSGTYSIHQTSALLTAPLAGLYHWLTGSMEGSLLFFRIIYALAMALTATRVYAALTARGAGQKAALFAALLIELMCPLAIPTLSYNTLLMIFLTLSLCALPVKGGRPERLLLSGAAMGCALLSYPPAVLCLPAYGWMAAPAAKDATGKTGRALWLLLIGMLAVAALAALSYLRTPPDALADMLQHLFRDPEHQGVTLAAKVRSYASGFLKTFGLLPLIMEAALFIAAVAFRVTRAEKRKRLLFGLILRGAAIAAVLSLIHIIRMEREGAVKINLVMHLLTALFPSLWLICDRKPKGLPALWLFGLSVSAAVHLSTNNGFIVSAYPLVFSAASVFVCAEGLIPRPQRRVRAAAAAIAACMVLLTGYYRVSSVYRDAALPALDTRIEAGVAKGLRTTAEKAGRYHALRSGLHAHIGQLEGKRLLVSPLLPWAYPETGAAVAAPGAWRVPLSDARLQDYYARYPALVPDAVLVVEDGAPNPPGGYWTSDRLKRDYYSNALEYGTLYLKNDTAMEGL